MSDKTPSPEAVAKRAAREKEALANFELITPKEAGSRRVVSAGILGVTGLLYTIGGPSLLSPGLWSLLATSSLSILGTAQKSVWGCSLAGKWKPDTAKPREVPKQFANYLWQKQKDFVSSMFFGVVAGVALTSAVLHFHAGVPVTPEMLLQMAIYSGGLVTFISLLSKYKY